LGKTKIFIKFPITLFKLEDERNKSKGRLATAIRANYLAHLYESRFQKMVDSATKIASGLRQLIAYREYEKKRASSTKIKATFRMFLVRRKFKTKVKAATKISSVVKMHQQRLRFIEALRIRREEAAIQIQCRIKRWIQRRKFVMMCRKLLPRYATPVIQNIYRTHLMRKFLHKLVDHVKKLNRRFYGIQFPKCLRMFSAANEQIKFYYRLQMATAYRKTLSPERKFVLSEKLFAAEMFKDKKKNYTASVAVPFRGDVIQLQASPNWTKIQEPGEKVLTAILTAKVNRSDLKQAARFLVLTSKNLYLLEKEFKLNSKIPLNEITGVSCTAFSDNLLLLHSQGTKKGDTMLIINNGFYEFVVRLRQTSKSIGLQITDKLNFRNEKENLEIVVTPMPGAEINFIKDKKGLKATVPS